MEFKFFKISQKRSAKLVAEYDSKIGITTRDAILDKCLDGWGAIGYTHSSVMGRKYVNALIFGRGALFPGANVVEVTEHGTACDGGALNPALSKLNEDLGRAPEFKDWLYVRLGVLRTAMSETKGATGGFKILRTYGGRCGGRIILAVPGTVGELPRFIAPISKHEFDAIVQGA